MIEAALLPLYIHQLAPRKIIQDTPEVYLCVGSCKLAIQRLIFLLQLGEFTLMLCVCRKNMRRNVAGVLAVLDTPSTTPLLKRIVSLNGLRAVPVSSIQSI